MGRVSNRAPHHARAAAPRLSSRCSLYRPRRRRAPPEVPSAGLARRQRRPRRDRRDDPSLEGRARGGTGRVSDPGNSVRTAPHLSPRSSLLCRRRRPCRSLNDRLTSSATACSPATRALSRQWRTCPTLPSSSPPPPTARFGSGTRLGTQPTPVRSPHLSPPRSPLLYRFWDVPTRWPRLARPPSLPVTGCLCRPPPHHRLHHRHCHHHHRHHHHHHHHTTTTTHHLFFHPPQASSAQCARSGRRRTRSTSTACYDEPSPAISLHTPPPMPTLIPRPSIPHLLSQVRQLPDGPNGRRPGRALRRRRLGGYAARPPPPPRPPACWPLTTPSPSVPQGPKVSSSSPVAPTSPPPASGSPAATATAPTAALCRSGRSLET